MPSQKAPWAQDVYRPSWQNSQVPSERANGLTTRSPFLTVVTSEPVSSTTPMNSCPIRAGPSAGDIEPYGHRSLPQMHEAVMRMSASVGCLTTESGTSSTRTSPAPYMWVARMSCLQSRFPCPAGKLVRAARCVVLDRQGRGPCSGGGRTEGDARRAAEAGGKRDARAVLGQAGEVGRVGAADGDGPAHTVGCAHDHL